MYLVWKQFFMSPKGPLGTTIFQNFLENPLEHFRKTWKKSYVTLLFLVFSRQMVNNKNIEYISLITEFRFDNQAQA